jgi:hypothetical protein
LPNLVLVGVTLAVCFEWLMDPTMSATWAGLLAIGVTLFAASPASEGIVGWLLTALDRPFRRKK